MGRYTEQPGQHLTGSVCVQLRRAEGDKQGYITRCEELDRGLTALTKGMPQQALERKYADVVSRMAGMQLHNSSLAHQLEATTASEKLLQVKFHIAGLPITLCAHSVWYARLPEKLQLLSTLGHVACRAVQRHCATCA